LFPAGLEIRLADSSFLTHGRTRVQRNEGVEIVVTVKNERNLASLTVYGDIEGQEAVNTSSSSNEIYITAGVVSILTIIFFFENQIYFLGKSFMEK
jgi:hypothetical protein